MSRKSIFFSVVIFLIVTLYPLFSQTDTIPIKLGIDVLRESDFVQLKGKKIALLTNHAGRTRTGELSVEVFLHTNVCKIVSLMTPEHGFYTTIPAGKSVGDETLFGLPVYSLYGANRRPSKKMLSNIDAVVVDLQDIGIRSYTYISTLYKTMDACAEYGIPVYILDRPNPMGGEVVDGNTVEKGMESFVGIIPVSYVHGCTIGELAEMLNGEGWLPADSKSIPRRCDLHIIKMEGWRRSMPWEQTGLLWYPTSPHIPTVDALRGAAMLGVYGELSVTSIGIGTTLPFQYIGSPYYDITNIEKEIGGLSFDGVNLVPAKYRPFYGMYNGKDCKGYLLRFPYSADFKPYTTGTRIILALRKAEPKLFDKSKVQAQSLKMFEKVTGSPKLFYYLFNGGTDEEVLKIAGEGLEEFKRIRNKYILYN